MTELTDAANLLNVELKGIQQAINGANWPAIYTTCVAALITSYVGWKVAMAATAYGASQNKQNMERSVACALYCEMRSINGYLRHMRIENSTPYCEIEVGKILNDNNICPVYLGLANNLGLLDYRIVDEIVDFYSNLLMIRNIRYISHEDQDRCFVHLMEVRRLEGLSDKALQALNDRYAFN